MYYYFATVVLVSYTCTVSVEYGIEFLNLSCYNEVVGGNLGRNFRLFGQLMYVGVLNFGNKSKTKKNCFLGLRKVLNFYILKEREHIQTST